MMSNTNLLRETLEKLNYSGQTPENVLWVGNYEGTRVVTWEEFAKIAAEVDYDSGYGANEIVRDLVIVGDTWWLDRGEYDGSEWWNFNTIPVRQESSHPFTRVVDDNTFAGDLDGANKLDISQ